MATRAHSAQFQASRRYLYCTAVGQIQSSGAKAPFPCAFRNARFAACLCITSSVLLRRGVDIFPTVHFDDAMGACAVCTVNVRQTAT